MKFEDIADLTNPETGKTYRQENNEKTHKYGIGDLVEVDGCRFFITRLTRDCDGTPLYSLESHGHDEKDMTLFCRVPQNKS